MRERSASQSLLGYYYQFDKTILEIMSQSEPTAAVTVEGIEDVDSESADGITAIQCKYYQSQRFHESSLKNPVALMLSDHVRRVCPINYRLYAHFGEAGEVDTRFTIDRLKNLLTYREKGEKVDFCRANGITDSQLAGFIGRFALELGPSHEVQHKAVIRSLAGHFDCSDEEADCYYYNNALRLVYDTATRVNLADRQIITKSFLSRINSREYLFNHWYLQLKKKDDYTKYVRRKLREQGALKTQKRVLVYMPSYMAASSEMMAITIREVALARFWRGRLRDAKPLTFVLGLDAGGVRDIKRCLLADQIAFNDGYESIAFSPRLFDRTPLIYRQKGGNRTLTEKIDEASYYLRIVGKSTYISQFASLEPPEVVIEFSGGRDQGLTLPNIVPFRVVGCDVAGVPAILDGGTK